MKTSRSSSVIFMGRRFFVPRGTKVCARPSDPRTFCIVDVAKVIDPNSETRIYAAAVRMGLNIDAEDVAVPGTPSYSGLETIVGVAT